MVELRPKKSSLSDNVVLMQKPYTLNLSGRSSEQVSIPGRVIPERQSVEEVGAWSGERDSYGWWYKSGITHNREYTIILIV